jgi:hypothetical protein
MTNSEWAHRRQGPGSLYTVSFRGACVSRQMILFGEESLRAAIHNFVTHYHTERNHQGLAN